MLSIFLKSLRAGGRNRVVGGSGHARWIGIGGSGTGSGIAVVVVVGGYDLGIGCMSGHWTGSRVEGENTNWIGGGSES